MLSITHIRQGYWLLSRASEVSLKDMGEFKKRNVIAM